MKVDRQVIYVSYGRLKIYSDAKEITAQNVVDEVNRAYSVHVQNRAYVILYILILKIKNHVKTIVPYIATRKE